MRCALFTSVCWIAIISMLYAYAITNQMIVIPNQTGYMEVRHNDLSLTPASFSASPRSSQQQLDALVQNVIQK